MPYTLRHSKISYKDSNGDYQPLDVLSQSSINDIMSNWMNNWVTQNPITVNNDSITSQHLQAGCIDFSHLSDQLKNEIIMTPQNNYIIPDMYCEQDSSICSYSLRCYIQRTLFCSYCSVYNDNMQIYNN